MGMPTANGESKWTFYDPRNRGRTCDGCPELFRDMQAYYVCVTEAPGEGDGPGGLDRRVYCLACHDRLTKGGDSGLALVLLLCVVAIVVAGIVWVTVHPVVAIVGVVAGGFRLATTLADQLC